MHKSRRRTSIAYHITLIDDVVVPSLSRPTEDFDVKHRDRDDPLVSDRVNDSTK